MSDRAQFILIVVGIVAAAAILVTAVMVQNNRASAAHVAACRAMGLASAEKTEQRGKTSVTSRFCFDKDGRVYWPGAR